MEYLQSAWLLLCGVCKRAVWIIPPLVLDPFDITGRVFDMDWIVPQWIAIALFIIGWIIAIALTYHDIRMQAINMGVELLKAKSSITQKQALASPKKRLNFYNRQAIHEVEEQMLRVHGHTDTRTMESDVMSGVLVGNLLNGICSRCGKPRNGEGGHVTW